MNSEISFFFEPIIALICAILLSYVLTPLIRVLAFKIKVIDIPKDNRRMHKIPIPQMGGAAILLSFLGGCLLFCNLSKDILIILGGAALMAVVGLIDDKFSMNAWVKLFCQIAIATLTCLGGVTINQICIGSTYYSLGFWSYPLTIFWIVGLTNAINIIDGLDGLSCGVSTISSISLLFVMLLQGGFSNLTTVIIVLIGACLGFLPYNKNPAKIFMGDTGALFLGYTLSCISIMGMFKMHAFISMFVPLIIFALPLFDTAFAFFRRLLSGKSPFHPDKGHLHHKLVAMGFTQKETVRILYSICGLLGLVAVFLCDNIVVSSKWLKAIITLAAALAIFIVYTFVLKNPSSRRHTGLLDAEKTSEETPNDDEIK